MKRLEIRAVSGYGAVILSFLYSTAAVFLPMFFAKGADYLFSLPVALAYWGVVVGMLANYLVESQERNEAKIRELMTRQFPGLETFYDAESFVNRLADVSVGASTVSTLNFSPPAGSSAALDRYFKLLHKYLSERRSKLSSFRSIASVENSAKANWLVERSRLFWKNPRVSLACFKEGSHLRLMGYHVVFKNGVGYSFFYPPVPLTGVMSGFLIVNNELATLMLSQFDLTWSKAVVTLKGGTPVKEGLEFLDSLGADNKAEGFSAMTAAATNDTY